MTDNNTQSNQNNPHNQSGGNYAYTGYAPNTAPSYNGYAPQYAGGYAPNAPKRRKWLIALIIIAAACAVIGLLIFSMVKFAESGGSSNKFVSPAGEYVAKISVVGEIGSANDPYTSSDAGYHHAWTMDTIDKITDDNSNKGLVIVVDSPGGGVYESDELYNRIENYKAKTERPVYVYMRSMAASGGYYISAPATKIIANRNTWTGSIGVIVGTMFDVSGFLEKNGIKAEDITSGPNKSMGSYFEPMTKEQRAIFQSMVDEAYNQFVGIVAKGRGMDAKTVKKIADGRIMTANQALAAGLIDGINGEEDFYDFVKKETGGAKIQNFRYNADTDILSSVFPSFIKSFDKDKGAIEGEVAQGDISRVLELAQTDGKVPIKYLYGE